MPGDPWANCEFHIKWKRYAYIQCSWDTRTTLSQLGGYKRVINYMKRWDDLQARIDDLCMTAAELFDNCQQSPLLSARCRAERMLLWPGQLGPVVIAGALVVSAALFPCITAALQGGMPPRAAL